MSLLEKKEASTAVEPDILSEKGLKTTIKERMEYVVTLLCDEPSDLEIIESKLTQLQIPFLLYCPYDPYNHDYDVIRKFFVHVESERKGPITFYLSNPIYKMSCCHCNIERSSRCAGHTSVGVWQHEVRLCDLSSKSAKCIG